MKETILIVEDDKDMSRLVEYNLDKNQYHPICVNDGEQALKTARATPPALIILDIMLPKMNGLEVCRALKRDSKTAAIPILMLTAKAEEVDKVVGLEMGADDYVTKPFSPRELIARVGSILRRMRPVPAQEVFRYGAVEVDFGRYAATLRGKPVALTTKEFALLKALLEGGGRALSREQLLSNVWGYDHAVTLETRTVDAHITHLRRKLRPLADAIVTVKGIGYRLDAGRAG
jgi:two-component system, OmpR family, phosphate regulon response regulator PhoB